MIAAQLTRFEALRAAVPEGATLGYVTDAEPGSTLENVLLHSAAYALAPHLLDANPNHDWVIGNFTQPRDFAAIGQSKGLQLQKDFGNGVVLYRRAR